VSGPKIASKFSPKIRPSRSAAANIAGNHLDYRPFEPYQSLNLARIDMNGSYIGTVENGNEAGRGGCDAAPA
jgi:hypothetical protein